MEPGARLCQKCRRRLEREKRERILQMVAVGWNYADIAVAVGTTEGAIQTNVARWRAQGLA